jgi:hypothetical protein
MAATPSTISRASFSVSVSARLVFTMAGGEVTAPTAAGELVASVSAKPVVAIPPPTLRTHPAPGGLTGPTGSSARKGSAGANFETGAGLSGGGGIRPLGAAFPKPSRRSSAALLSAAHRRSVSAKVSKCGGVGAFGFGSLRTRGGGVRSRGATGRGTLVARAPWSTTAGALWLAFVPGHPGSSSNQGSDEHSHQSSGAVVNRARTRSCRPDRSSRPSRS